MVRRSSTSPSKPTRAVDEDGRSRLDEPRVISFADGRDEPQTTYLISSRELLEELGKLSPRVVHLSACEQSLSPEVRFRAEGDTAMAAQVEIVTSHIKATEHTTMAAYLTFAFLVAVSGILVVFAPSGRETAAMVAAAAIFAVALVMGGIKVFQIKLPGGEFSTGPANGSPPRSDRGRLRRATQQNLNDGSGD